MDPAISPSANTSIFEPARLRAKEDTKKEADADEAEEKDERQVDYLTPFLAGAAQPKDPSREEAQGARDACLKALKERLLERGAELIEPLRETPHERFFFRDPNGYIFEVMERK